MGGGDKSVRGDSDFPWDVNPIPPTLSTPHAFVSVLPVTWNTLYEELRVCSADDPGVSFAGRMSSVLVGQESILGVSRGVF